MVGRAGFEPATTCIDHPIVGGVCQAGILTRLDDRPMMAVNVSRQDKDSTGTRGQLDSE